MLALTTVSVYVVWCILIGTIVQFALYTILERLTGTVDVLYGVSYCIYKQKYEFFCKYMQKVCNNAFCTPSTDSYRTNYATMYNKFALNSSAIPTCLHFITTQPDRAHS